MPLKITQRKAEEVPSANRQGKVNEDLVALKAAMSNLAADMVLEIEAGSEKAVRGTKMLVSKAAKELGAQWRHWNVGSTVFAKPMEAVRRRGRRPKAKP